MNGYTCMNPLTRHRKLLENKKVERWYENLKARSQVTSDIYIRNFGLWLEYLNHDPESIIIFAKDHFEDFKGSVSDNIRELEKKGTMGSSAFRLRFSFFMLIPNVTLTLLNLR